MAFDFELDAFDFDFKNMCILLLLTLSSLPRSFFDLHFYRTDESQNEPACDEKQQISSKALEACRVAVNKYLTKNIGKDVYPPHSPKYKPCSNSSPPISSTTTTATLMSKSCSSPNTLSIHGHCQTCWDGD